MKEPICIYCPTKFVWEPLADEITYVTPNRAAAQLLGLSAGGVPEQSLIGWAIDMFPEGKDFVDVGAHVGTYALNFALSEKVNKVWAFEAQKNTADALLAGAIVNNLDDKVYVFTQALGSPEQIGFVDLKIIDDSGNSSSVCDLPTNINPKRIEVVPCKPLDSLFIDNIGLIKIDVQCGELEVLQGAVKTLEKSGWPLIIFEALDIEWNREKKQRTFDFIDSINYNIFPITYYPEMFLAVKK